MKKKTLIAGVFVAVAVAAATAAGVATQAGDDPAREMREQEMDALDELADEATDPRVSEVVAWIERTAAPGGAVDPGTQTPSPQEIAAAEQRNVLLAELAQLWLPLEERYSAADESGRQQMLETFVLTNLNELDRIRQADSALLADLGAP